MNRELDIARGEARRLAQLVEEDVLCGVLNRRGFERALRQALAFVWRHGTAATLLFVDLDGFKAINDSFGHAEGDRALQRVAERLQRQLRSSDVIARIGGDEFAVILWHASIDQARLKAATLEQAIAAGDNPVAVSIGVATLAGRDPSAVLDAADRDMYARKRERQAMMSGVSLSNR